MTEYYGWEVEDLFKAFRECLHVEPSELRCPCGCGNSLVFAKDERALWLASTIAIAPTIQIRGIETIDEFDQFIKHLIDTGIEGLAEVAERLRPLAPAERGTRKSRCGRCGAELTSPGGPCFDCLELPPDGSRTVH